MYRPPTMQGFLPEKHVCGSFAKQRSQKVAQALGRIVTTKQAALVFDSVSKGDMAYVVEQGGFEIYVMDANGSNPRNLTASGGSNESPSWSRDSRYVVFTSTREGKPQLWTANAATGQNRKVPGISVAAQGPDWGPRRGR